MEAMSKEIEVETVAHSMNDLERLIAKGNATIVVDLPRYTSITPALWEELVERGLKNNAVVKMARPIPNDRCLKCGGHMRAGKAMLDPDSANAYAGEAPESAKLVDCLKCCECGYSETLTTHS